MRIIKLIRKLLGCHLTKTQYSMIGILSRRRLWRKLFNYILVEAQTKIKSSYLLGYPYWLTIDPTNVCQLRCPFCPTGFGNMKRPKGMITMENFKNIIDVLGPYLLHIDMQNWGEPLLHKDIYQMISYAKKFNIHVTLSTNFQNFDEKSAEDTINSRLDRLILSIDGASQQTYEKYRRGGNFFKVIENIKILLRKKRELKSRLPIIIWQFLVFRHNEHEINMAKKLGRQLGVDSVGINSAFIAADSEEYKDWIPLNSAYSRYDLSGGPKTIVNSDSFLKSSNGAICNWLWRGITINWDGSVSPCCGVYLEEEDFGNIFDLPLFRQLWNNVHYRIARKFVRGKKKPHHDIKNTCVNCNKIGQINIDLNPDFWIRG